MENFIEHYGTPRHSGRYPWGSGENPYQRNSNFLKYVKDQKSKGKTDAEIARGMGMTSKQLRARLSMAKDENRMANVAEAIRLKNKGYSVVAIGNRMGVNESTVRSWLDPARKERTNLTKTTANVLKDQIAKKTYLDIGRGTENYMGISRTKLDTAVEMLKEEGYVVKNIKVLQQGTGQYTTVRVLAPPGSTMKDISSNRDKIQSVAEWSYDGGRSYLGLEKPTSVSSDRIKVNYYEDGGKDKDGVIELRRGVADISLGDSTYAQVRIAVDDSHFLKGMAVYRDDMPKGVDIIFNTNKHKIDPVTGKKNSKLDTMKPLKDDPDNPFGAEVKQRKYIDKDGKEKLSAINLINKEGDWEGWKKTLSSQMLSKQTPELAKKQLELAYQAKQSQFDEIMSLTNPVVRQKLLMSFAEDCDSSSVHLEAAALPRQASHVILPLTSIKDNEIYAPRYRDGEKVVLVRYPHGGKFEIPELTVNNKNREGKSVITPKSKDAVGINSKVAEQLSGADFDGDTVLVIPNNNRGKYKVQTASPLKDLKDFDPKESYPAYEGMKPISPRTKQIEMGKVSNLITDMTIKGANQSEIARAVRHSMVVIDSEKHNLNYKQSYIDNGIAELSKNYQGKAGGGASTLISRASSEVRVPIRGREIIDRETGEKSYLKPKDTTYFDKKTGTVKTRTTKTTKMSETRDAFSLSSGSTVMETIYAKHANKLKDLANTARKEAVNTKMPEISRSAKKTYEAEVAKLKADLNIAKMNAPFERQAQLLSGTIVKAKRDANPYMTQEELKKVKSQALKEARDRVGAKKKQIIISDREWEAIQSGAIGSSVLKEILNNADEERVKQLATPKKTVSMSPARISRAKAMLDAGCTQAEVADILGVSVSTLSKSLT